MYKVTFEPSAKKFLIKLDQSNRKIIFNKLKKLKSNAELGKPLVGSFSGLRSLRIGKYRVIYKILNEVLIIVVLDIGHRKNIYK
jgi:mRNA interferase RelE/StbE